MAPKKSGLGRGLDALFPDKNSQNKPKTTTDKPKTTVRTQKANISADVSATQKKEVKQPAEVKAEKEMQPVSQVTAQPVEEPAVQQTEPEIKTPEVMVKISSVEPNREQPRKQFNEEALQELAESIKQYGILQPLLVSDKKDYYEIIAGERRWRAAKIAGLKEIPVIIKEFSEREIVEVSLIENIQREDLNPIEEAMAYKRLIEEFSLKQEEVAEKVSRSRTAVANSVRLLKLNEKVQQYLIDDKISSGHARALLSLPEGEMQIKIAERIMEESLSVREVEKLVKGLLEPDLPRPPKKPANPAEDAIYENLEERMKQIMGTKVFINRKRKNKGKIEIEYYSRDELERIIDLFESIR